MEYHWYKASSMTSSREKIQNELSSILEDFVSYCSVWTFLNLQVFMFILSSHILFLWVFWVYEHVFLCVYICFLCFSFGYFFSYFALCFLRFILLLGLRLFLMRAKKEGYELGSKSMWKDLDLGVRGGKTLINILYEINLFSS